MDVPVGVEVPRGNDTWHYGRKMVVMKKLAVGRGVGEVGAAGRGGWGGWSVGLVGGKVRIGSL